MRKLLSTMFFLVAATLFAQGAGAQEQVQLSPLQSQLKKMQSGENYGMKTVSSTPPTITGPAESRLNDNAKALANRAMTQNTQEPSRLEKIETAYRAAESPKPVPTHEEIKPGAKPAEKAPEKANDDPDRTPVEKAIDKTEKQGEDARKLRDAQMLYEGINSDRPKTPPRLIPVE